MRPDRKGRMYPHSHCRTCRRADARERKRRQRAEAARSEQVNEASAPRGDSDSLSVVTPDRSDCTESGVEHLKEE